MNEKHVCFRCITYINKRPDWPKTLHSVVIYIYKCKSYLLLFNPPKSYQIHVQLVGANKQNCGEVATAAWFDSVLKRCTHGVLIGAYSKTVLPRKLHHLQKITEYIIQEIQIGYIYNIKFFFYSKVLTFLKFHLGFYPIKFSENIINSCNPKKRSHMQLEQIYSNWFSLSFFLLVLVLFCFFIYSLVCKGVWSAIPIMKINNYKYISCAITMFRSLFKL